jgi:hypothetical protein
MILVGISGAIDHGKTSLAEFLKAATPSASHLESSDVVIEVANALRNSGPTPRADSVLAILSWLQALPAILLTYTHTTITFEALNINAERIASAPQEFGTLLGYLRIMELQPELATKPINSSNKDDFRMLLQWLGGYLAKNVSGTLWYDEIVRLAHATGNDFVIAGGVRFLEDAACIRNAGGFILNVVRPTLGEQESQDITENERALISPDCVVVNDSSLEALKMVADQIYIDLTNGTLQPSYQASLLG